MNGKRKSDPESVSGTGSPPKVKQFFRLIVPIIILNFNEMGSLLFFGNPAHRMTHRQANRQTDRQTDSTDHINSLAEVINKAWFEKDYYSKDLHKMQKLSKSQARDT